MRSPIPLPIDVLELLRTGRFDCLQIGRTKELILHDFPAPDDWSSDATSFEGAAIWRYGNIELHFDDERLCLIFSDSLDTLDGGPSLAVDPWILGQSDQLTLRDITRALERERIEFTKTTRVFADATYVAVMLTLSSGVVLQFDQNEDGGLDRRARVDIDHDELRLGSFSLGGSTISSKPS